MSAKRLPGMDTFGELLRRMLMYPVAYLAWFTGITGALTKMVSRRPGVIVLNYHRINERTDETAGGYPGNITSVGNFSRHVDYLKRNFSFITPDDLLDYLKGQKEIKGTRILFTFDDGYRDTYRFGLPILHRHELPSVVFVASGVLEGKFILPADRYAEGRTKGNQVRPLSCGALYLSGSDIPGVRAFGSEIGSHSVTHPVMAELSLEDQEREIVLSRKRIEGHSGDQVRFFSYPMGKISAETREIVERAGYHAAFGNHRGCVTRTTDRFCLPRISVSNHSVPVLALKLLMIRLFYGDRT